jgi:hypothetical protein
MTKVVIHNHLPVRDARVKTVKVIARGKAQAMKRAEQMGYQPEDAVELEYNHWLVKLKS